jgi:hypothetical protein
VLEIDPRRLPPKADIEKRINAWQSDGTLPESVRFPIRVVLCDGVAHVHGIGVGDLVHLLTWSREHLRAITPELVAQEAEARGKSIESLVPIIEQLREFAAPDLPDGVYMFYGQAGCDEPLPLSDLLIAPISPPIVLKGFPGFWELFGYLLDRQTRERVFDPAFHDLMADYLRTRSATYRGPIATGWLLFAFTFRTAMLVVQSLRAIFGAAVLAFLTSLIPQGIRQRIWDWWQSGFLQ